MIPIYEHYQLKEKPASKISPVWKFTHLLIFAIICILSFVSSYSFGDFTKNIDSHCVLFTKVLYKPVYAPSNCTSNYTINDTKNITNGNKTEDERILSNNYTDIDDHFDVPRLGETEECRFRRIYPQFEQKQYTMLWGKHSYCNAYQILQLISMLAGLVCFIFTWLINGTIMRTKSYTMVLPMLFCCFIIGISQIYNSIKFHDGFHSFCKQFINYTQSEMCTNAMNLYGRIIIEEEHNYYLFYLICHICTTLVLSFWIAQFLIYLLRIIFVADFIIEKVTVYDKEDQSRVLNELKKSAIEKSFKQKNPLTFTTSPLTHGKGNLTIESSEEMSLHDLSYQEAESIPLNALNTQEDQKSINSNNKNKHKRDFSE